MKLIILNNEDPSICKPCGGQCCKHLPGENRPEDFGAPGPRFIVLLTAALASKRYAVDWWEQAEPGVNSEADTYYVRPAIVGVTRLVHGTYGGQCNFLVDNKCELTWEVRPHGCKALVPTAGKSCNQTPEHHKREYAKTWLPYQVELLQALNAVDSMAVTNRHLDPAPRTAFSRIFESWFDD